jgi:hypothetical protein
MRIFSKTIDKLKGALRRTATVLTTDVRTLFIPGRQIDDAFLIELEERLIRADIGVANASAMPWGSSASNCSLGSTRAMTTCTSPPRAPR